MTVCANYIEGGSATSSNMAVMEIYLPSGFTVDRDSLYALRRYKGIKRVDPERGDTKVKRLIITSFKLMVWSWCTVVKSVCLLGLFK